MAHSNWKIILAGPSGVGTIFQSSRGIPERFGFLSQANGFCVLI